MASVYEVFCDPSVAAFNTVRTDCVSTNNVGVVGGACSSIFGGVPAATPNNTNNADLSTILNGQNQTISIFAAGPPAVPGEYNLIGNGSGNTVAGFFSGIALGEDNNVCGTHSMIGSGHSNCIGSASAAAALPVDFSFIGGGESNLIDSDATNAASYGAIGGGLNNQIIAGVNHANIGGGSGNMVNGDCSNISGGDTNGIGGGASMLPAGFSFIGGGQQNFITTTAALGNTFGVIGGGEGNYLLENSNASFIGGGKDNRVSADHSVLSGGENNFVGGLTPGVDCACYNFLGGGQRNCIESNNQLSVFHNVLGGGCTNTICTDTCHSFLGGGNINCVEGNWNGLVGGCNNRMNCCFSFIGGGLNNNITLTGAAPVGTSAIVAGNDNRILNHSVYSTIGNGVLNRIDNTFGSFIGSGTDNCIAAVLPGPDIERSFIGGGYINTVNDSCASIVGGMENTINAGGVGGFIGGGLGNVVSGNYSAVLGGSGNNDGGFAFAGIFGNGINAVANDMFHVSCLNAVNTPVLAGQPLGTLTYVNATPGMVAAGFPLGSKIAMIA